MLISEFLVSLEYKTKAETVESWLLCEWTEIDLASLEYNGCILIEARLRLNLDSFQEWIETEKWFYYLDRDFSKHHENVSWFERFSLSF